MKKVNLLSRSEMKNVMGGGVPAGGGACAHECTTVGADCSVDVAGGGTFSGICKEVNVANDGCTPDNKERLCSPKSY